MINFRKGSKDEFAKLPPEAEFGDRADIIRRHLAEVFGSKIFGSAVKIPTTFRVRDADPTPNSDDTQVRDLWYVPEDPRLGWNS